MHPGSSAGFREHMEIKRGCTQAHTRTPRVDGGRQSRRRRGVPAVKIDQASLLESMLEFGSCHILQLHFWAGCVDACARPACGNGCGRERGGCERVFGWECWTHGTLVVHRRWTSGSKGSKLQSLASILTVAPALSTMMYVNGDGRPESSRMRYWVLTPSASSSDAMESPTASLPILDTIAHAWPNLAAAVRAFPQFPPPCTCRVDAGQGAAVVIRTRTFLPCLVSLLDGLKSGKEGEGGTQRRWPGGLGLRSAALGQGPWGPHAAPVALARPPNSHSHPTSSCSVLIFSSGRGYCFTSARESMPQDPSPRMNGRAGGAPVRLVLAGMAWAPTRPQRSPRLPA